MPATPAERERVTKKSTEDHQKVSCASEHIKRGDERNAQRPGERRYAPHTISLNYKLRTPDDVGPVRSELDAKRWQKPRADADPSPNVDNQLRRIFDACVYPFGIHRKLRELSDSAASDENSRGPRM
jgi:hypothetical protein